MLLGAILVLLSIIGIINGVKKKNKLLIAASLLLLIFVIVVWTYFYNQPY